MRLSPIVAGLWRLHEWGLDAAQTVSWVEQALELGVSSFDHADIYGDYQVESLFGEALASAPGLRNRLQIVTKCGIRRPSAARPAHRIKSYDSSGAHVRASVEQSLRALRCEHLDLLLMHRPDLLMDPDELAGTFDQLRAEGKVLAFGVSNHSVSQVALLHRRHALVTHQIELSPLRMQALDDGTLEQCLDMGLQPMIWSPLGGGVLFSGQDAQALRVRTALEELAREYACAPASVAFAWILRHPSRPIPITGTHRIEGLREAVAAQAVPLTREDWYRVWQAGAGREVA